MTPLPVTPLPAAAPMRRSIAGRLLFWFLVIALIPCAVLTAITARIAASSLERSVRDNLTRIAAAKAIMAPLSVHSRRGGKKTCAPR
jgi:methyl-accepting chemotaxis protein WspA